MNKMARGNKKITTIKIPATNTKVLVHTGSLHFFKIYRQPIIKFWCAPVLIKIILVFEQYLKLDPRYESKTLFTTVLIIILSAHHLS